MFRLQLVESSVIVCRANQFTGFYMMTTLAFNELLSVIFVFLENYAQKQEENEKAMFFFVVFRKTFGNE